MITSSTVPDSSLRSNDPIASWSGLTPFNGEIEPISTWYRPLNSCVFSTGRILFDSSTTQSTRSDRDGCVQNWHGSTSVRLLHVEQRLIDRFTSRMDSASSLASA